MVSLKETLKLFPDFIVLTENASLDRMVSSVSVMDAPDIHRWMKGGELLITSGYLLSLQQDTFIDLIEKLHRKGISALGIKVSRYMHKLPPVILEKANQLDLPIIEIPERYAFTEIISPVLTEIVNRRYVELQQSEEMGKRFLKIGVDDVSYIKILNLLRLYIQEDVFYFSHMDQEIFSPFAQRKKDLSEDEKNNYIAYDVKYQKINYGTIYISKPLTAIRQRMALDHAITIFRLSIQSSLSSKRLEHQRRNDFLSDLIQNNIQNKEEILFRSQEYGWKWDDRIYCIFVQLKPTSMQRSETRRALAKKSQDILDGLRSSVKTHYQNVYYLQSSDSMVLLFIGRKNLQSKDSVQETLSSWVAHTKPTIPIAIGIGRMYSDINETWRSYEDARKTAILGRSLFGSQKVYDYNDIALYDHYWKNSESLEDIPMVKLLITLQQEDQRDNSEHMTTIKALIQADWTQKRASDLSQVHYNTLKYRVSRLKERTGWSLETREEKFQIELAYKLFLLIEKQKVQNPL